MRKLFHNFVGFFLVQLFCYYFADTCKTQEFQKILTIFTNKENKHVFQCLLEGVFLHYVTSGDQLKTQNCSLNVPIDYLVYYLKLL